MVSGLSTWARPRRTHEWRCEKGMPASQIKNSHEPGLNPAPLRFATFRSIKRPVEVSPVPLDVESCH